MNDKTNDETLLEFPCDFPIKSLGRSSDAFADTVRAIVEQHAGPVEDSAIESTPSRNGRFVSVTITINATSREQLDNIYQGLTDSDDVLMAL